MKKEDNMFAEVRKQMIVDVVNRETKITVSKLCEQFDVSPATIRNDLRELEEAGLLKRTHGGAICNRKTTYEPNAYQKEVEHVAQKQAIARCALNCIQKGDCIALDTGTTTFELAKLLVRIEDITVVTNDLQIAAFLERNSDAHIIMAGGAVRRNFHCTVGQAAMDTVAGLNVDKAFLAANAVSIKRGICTPNMDVARVKTVFLQTADEVILLADSSKMGKAAFVRFADIEEIDMVITDDGVDKAFAEQVQRAGTDIQIAENEKK